MHVSPAAGAGRGRATTPLTLTVANDGNLAIPLAAVVRARTDDGGPDPGPDVTLTLADRPRWHPARPPCSRGTSPCPPSSTPPGGTPRGIPVGTADLDVIILPRDPSE